MSLNSLTVKKFLLTAGLLLVLVQGLWQLPELQDYFFPVDNAELILKRASNECPLIERDLIALSKRVNYLKWFQADHGPDQKVSVARLLSFPLSECIRPLAPEYFWHINITLAQKTRLKIERKLRHLNVLLKSINGDFRVPPSQASPAIPEKPAPVSDSMEQIQQFKNQCLSYNDKLNELTKQLAWLENNGYKNQSALYK